MSKKIKALFLVKKHIRLIIGIISLLAILFSLNKYWAPYDEGIVTVAAERVLSGEVLYKDIFILMYPPGQVYVLSLLYKVFGISIGIGRLFSGMAQVMIAVTVFAMSRKLTGSIRISLGTWFFTLLCLAPRMGAIPAPIWTGMAFSLFAIYLFAGYVETGNRKELLLSGLVAGIATIFRHDIGLFAFVSILAAMGIFRSKIRELFSFIAAWLLFPGAFLLYFIAKSAVRPMIESLILFPFTHVRTAGHAFPLPCLDINMIFHKSLFFIKINQYYIPILVYAIALLYIGYIFIKDRKLDKYMVIVSVILMFGLLTFNQVRIRTDTAHLLTVISPAAILFGIMLARIGRIRHLAGKFRYPVIAYISLVAFLFFLLTVKNIDKAFKNTIRKPYKGKTILTEFARGKIYIPRDEQEAIVDLVRYIKRNTDAHERIFIGNSTHSVDAFGGSLFLYTLCERLPSTKYYEIAPGLITERYVQEEMRDSLESWQVRFVVLQDIITSGNMSGGISPFEAMVLDRYLEKNFKLVRKIGKYGVYKKSDIY